MFANLFEICLEKEESIKATGDLDGIKRHTYIAVLNECLQEHNVFNKTLNEKHWYTKEELIEKVDRINKLDNVNIEFGNKLVPGSNTNGLNLDELYIFITEVNYCIFNKFIGEDMFNNQYRKPYWLYYPESFFEYVNTISIDYKNRAGKGNIILREVVDDGYIYLTSPVLSQYDNQKLIRYIINSIPDFLYSRQTYEDYKDDLINYVNNSTEGGKYTFKYVFNECFNEYTTNISDVVFALPFMLYMYNDVNGLINNDKVNKNKNVPIKIPYEEIFYEIYKDKIDINDVLDETINTYEKKKKFISEHPILCNPYPLGQWACNDEEISICATLSDYINHRVKVIGLHDRLNDYTLIFNYLVFANRIHDVKTMMISRKFNQQYGFNQLVVPIEIYRAFQQMKELDEYKDVVKHSYSEVYKDNYNGYIKTIYIDEEIINDNNNNDNNEVIIKSNVMSKETIDEFIEDNKIGDFDYNIPYNTNSYVSFNSVNYITRKNLHNKQIKSKFFDLFLYDYINNNIQSDELDGDISLPPQCYQICYTIFGYAKYPRFNDSKVNKKNKHNNFIIKLLGDDALMNYTEWLLDFNLFNGFIPCEHLRFVMFGNDGCRIYINPYIYKCSEECRNKFKQNGKRNTIINLKLTLDNKLIIFNDVVVKYNLKLTKFGDIMRYFRSIFDAFEVSNAITHKRNDYLICDRIYELTHNFIDRMVNA